MDYVPYIFFGLAVLCWLMAEWRIKVARRQHAETIELLSRPL